MTTVINAGLAYLVGSTDHIPQIVFVAGGFRRGSWEIKGNCFDASTEIDLPRVSHYALLAPYLRNHDGKYGEFP